MARPKKKAPARWFVDRQVLLRTESGVRQIRIHRRDQILAVVVAAGVGVWGLATSVSTGVLAMRQIDSAATITHLEIGYAQLISRISRSGDGLESQVDEDVSLAQRLVAHNNALTSRVEALERGWARLAGERATLAADLAAERTERERIQAELEATLIALDEEEIAAERLEQVATTASGNRDEALVQLREARAQRTRAVRRADEADARADALGAHVHDLSLAVQSASRTVRSVADERDRLAGERDDLELRLTHSEDRSGRLSAALSVAQAQVTALSGDQEGLAAELRRLSDALESERQDLAVAHLRISGLERGLSLMRWNAETLSHVRDTLADANVDLVGQVRRLDEELSTVRLIQDQFLADLRDRLEIRVEGMTTVIASLGLDVDAMLAEVNLGDQGAYGGPLLPELPDYLLDYDGWADVDEVLTLADHASSLGTLVSVLPIGAPATENVRLSSGFGVRRDPLTGRPSRHEGLDFAGPPGTPIYATGPGTVVHAGWRGAFGRMVEIEHAFGLVTRYAHMSSVAVEAGDVVAYGDPIGAIGNSGRSTGPHLHYEVHVLGTPRDPMSFLGAGYDVLEIADVE